MSDVIDTVTGQPIPVPDASAPAPEPRPEPSPAPADPGDAPQPDTPPEPKDEEPKPRLTREERRAAHLSAQLTALRAEVDRMRQAQPPTGLQPPQPWPQTPEELERLIEERSELKAAQKAAQARADAFHRAGQAANPDWRERCQALMDMGADGAFSQLLVEMDDGAKVAAALADDPEAMERIAAIRTERGRAISLGMYAAKLAEQAPPARPAPRRASAAPAPIRPVNGSVNPTPNEYSMDMDQLLSFYSQQNMDRINGRKPR